jgi:mannose-6-phosphate isomerase
MTDAARMIVPLPLAGALHETIWGGRALAERLGKSLPAGALVGESWETADESLVREGPYAGESLAALVARLGAGLLGLRAVAVYGRRFPLLTKFIDAREQLSVQVHPDDVYAARHEHGKLGKTETWYVLHAEPGAQLIYGFARATSSDEVRRAIERTRLEPLLHSFDPRPGDVIFVPPGTVHAIGGGILLYELQEYSDVTYRLYDYGRVQADGTTRELHVERALEVLRYSPVEEVRATPLEAIPYGEDGSRRVLVACRYFVEEELRVAGEVADATTPASCQILTCLGGACTIEAGGAVVRLRRGETAVLPAALGAYRLHGEPAQLMRAYVPEERDPLLDAWLAAQGDDVAG